MNRIQESQDVTYKINGHLVKEITGDLLVLLKFKSNGEMIKKSEVAKWTCQAFCTQENKEITLYFPSLRKAKEYLEMFSYSLQIIAE